MGQQEVTCLLEVVPNLPTKDTIVSLLPLANNHEAYFSSSMVEFEASAT